MDYSDLAKKRAVALKYDSSKGDAPTVVATGRGLIAENIVNTAKEAGVTVHEDSNLAQALGSLDLGSEIPELLYDVVAEILLFVADMDEKKLQGVF
jgi:flagellar biosynthesis protein